MVQISQRVRERAWPSVTQPVSPPLIPCPPQQMGMQQQKEGLNKMPLFRGTRAREEGGQGGRTLTQPFLSIWLSWGPGVRKNLRDLHVLGAVAV